MNFDLDKIINDIKVVLDARHIPMFFGENLYRFAENVHEPDDPKANISGRRSKAESLLGRMVKDTRKLADVASRGCGKYNMFPSETYGNLENDYLGICPEDANLKNVLVNLSHWCSLHSDLKLSEKKHAVILTEKWDPKTFTTFKDTFNISVNTLDMKIVVILLAEHGASEVKLL